MVCKKILLSCHQMCWLLISPGRGFNVGLVGVETIGCPTVLCFKPPLGSFRRPFRGRLYCPTTATDYARAAVADWDQIPAARIPKSCGNPSQKRGYCSRLRVMVWGEIFVPLCVYSHPSSWMAHRVSKQDVFLFNTSLSRMSETNARY